MIAVKYTFINYHKFILCCRFTAWPEDALEKVAQNFLKQMDIDDNIREKCVVMCKEFHTTVQKASKRY